jgi:hypothetical protein
VSVILKYLLRGKLVLTEMNRDVSRPSQRTDGDDVNGTHIQNRHNKEDPLALDPFALGTRRR